MRKHSINFTLLLLAICFLLSDHSAAQHMNAVDAPCRGPATTLDEMQCLIAASKVADERLERTYNRVREVLSKDEQNDLQQAQRLWLKYRDANCSAERNLYGGGTAAPVVHAACMEADTRERTAELKTMYGWRLKKFGKDVE